MKNENKTGGGIYLFDDPNEFLKMMDELQELYNSSSNEDGVELDDY